RLISALEAPCPYIVGIERRYDNIELPEDDFVLVDLDQDEIQSIKHPPPLPRQQRRKLVSLLQVAAPHHNRFGVQVGPPPYAMETFPYDAFSSENPSVFVQNALPSSLAKYVGLNSANFGEEEGLTIAKPCFNAFLHSKTDNKGQYGRPSTSYSDNKPSSPPSPGLSPISTNFPPVPTTPITPISRNDSGFALTATLREKRSGHFDSSSRRSFSVSDILVILLSTR